VTFYINLLCFFSGYRAFVPVICYIAFPTIMYWFCLLNVFFTCLYRFCVFCLCAGCTTGTCAVKQRVNKFNLLLLLLLLLLFSRLYDVSTSSCAHSTIILYSSSSCLCHSSLLPLIPFPPSVL